MTADGVVYAFGLNGMGQCGFGHTSNNVWKPKSVTGLSSEFATGKRVDLPQSYPIQQTALGLQRTYVLIVRCVVCALLVVRESLAMKTSQLIIRLFSLFVCLVRTISSLLSSLTPSICLNVQGATVTEASWDSKVST